MSRIIPNARFGDLTVIELVSGEGAGAQARCKCICGARVKIPTWKVKRRTNCGGPKHEVARAG